MLPLLLLLLLHSLYWVVAVDQSRQSVHGTLVESGLIKNDLLPLFLLSPMCPYKTSARFGPQVLSFLTPSSLVSSFYLSSVMTSSGPSQQKNNRSLSRTLSRSFGVVCIDDLADLPLLDKETRALADLKLPVILLVHLQRNPDAALGNRDVNVSACGVDQHLVGVVAVEVNEVEGLIASGDEYR